MGFLWLGLDKIQYKAAHLPMNQFNARRAVKDSEPFRLLCGEKKVSFSDPLMKLDIFLLESILQSGIP
jgi:hypothetical protein